MWNAFVHRRNGGGYDDVSSLQFIELTDEDCELLIAAGLKIEKGASPRDLYCFQNLPYYDGTPLQVLRLLEEARSAGRNARKDDVEPVEAFEIQGNKRQRVEEAYSGASGLLSNLTLWSQPKKDLSIDLELLDDGDEGSDFVEVIRVSSSKLPPSPVKNTRAAAAAKVSSPVQASLATLPAIFRSGSNTMAIDTSSAHEEIFTPSSSTRKRKSKARSTSTLAALFSPRTSIRTPSPGLKTRRSSVLKEFETPEQPTGSETPQTVPAKSKRVSVTPPQYTKTTFELSECEDENDEANDGLVDDSPEDDERACCDVRSVVEPIWEALQRTSSMLQNAWEEVRALSSSLVLIPMSGEDPERRTHLADVRDDAVDLLVLEGDPESDQSNRNKNKLTHSWFKQAENGGVGMRTRRQQREIRRLSAASTWRLW